MLKLLLDANLSPKTAKFLQSLGYEATTVAQFQLGLADDETIVKYAAAHGHIIITFDLDFGYLFRFLFPYEVGIVVLRLENQTVEPANAALKRLLDTRLLDDDINQKALIVVDETTIRVRSQ